MKCYYYNNFFTVKFHDTIVYNFIHTLLTSVTLKLRKLGFLRLKITDACFVKVKFNALSHADSN